jgi:hypothetical protein
MRLQEKCRAGSTLKRRGSGGGAADALLPCVFRLVFDAFFGGRKGLDYRPGAYPSPGNARHGRIPAHLCCSRAMLLTSSALPSRLPVDTTWLINPL